MQYKRNINIIIFTVLLFISASNIFVTAEEELYCCGMVDLNNKHNPWDTTMSLFSEFNKFKKEVAPSTGTVRALVLPITFPNHSISKERIDMFDDEFFGMHSDVSINDFSEKPGENYASTRDILKVNSDEKLYFTGDILPLYEVSYMPDYYNQNPEEVAKMVNEILTYYKNNNIITDFSQYDSDNNGTIDCLIMAYPFFSDLIYNPNPDSFKWMSCVNGGVYKADGEDIAAHQIIFYTYTDIEEYNFLLGGETVAHEYGHLMGLYDNYNNAHFGVENKCTLYGGIDLWGLNSDYVNPYYRYILDWI